ncbi:MAG: radical SAM protein [Elusimicrobia bacterium]|nr:radical SAM protein [Elusimicrobiota bacterium]
MKVTLLNCPMWATREPPIRVAQVSGSLKSKGIPAYCFDVNNYLYKKRSEENKNLWAWEQVVFWGREENIKEYFKENKEQVDFCIKQIVDSNPDIICFWLMTSSYTSSMVFLQILKEYIRKDTKIVFFGELFQDKKYIDFLFENSCPDYIIPGEPDLTLIELLNAIENQKDLSLINGICYKQDNKIVKTQAAVPPQDLDKLPFPDYKDLSIDDYDDNEHFAIETSRGCVWRCAFCRCCAYWGKYREISAERLHQEINYYKISHPNVIHIDFLDLEINANVERLEEFCDLMIKYPPLGTKMIWLANAIINPKMTETICRKVKESGCDKLIFGIETGSPRLLKLMNKGYKQEDAKYVLKNVSQAGIKVTGNFMFGFPGETEEDFQQTLEFITETGKYFERVYPSRSYCAIEQFSTLHEHPEKFGIKTPFNHHLYWETIDGKNTYPVRLNRCKRFEQKCHELGVRVDVGVQTNVDMAEFFNLGLYYEYIKDYEKAKYYLNKYLELDPNNEFINKKIAEIKKQTV